jgi:hypothetical protein
MSKKIGTWSQTPGDPQMEGLVLAGLEVSFAEIEDLCQNRWSSEEAGIPADLLDDYECQTPEYRQYSPGDVLKWLRAGLEESTPTWNLIHSYSRSDAIRDGVLVDVTEQARETGFKIPVALTRAVWDEHVKVSPKVVAQDERGRLHDILFCLYVAIGKTGLDADTVSYQLYVRNTNGKPKLVNLKATCGPGDDLAPAITVLKPMED